MPNDPDLGWLADLGQEDGKTSDKSAEGAVDANLIDSVGYLDEAIARMKELAGVKAAQVVEYKRPFSWTRLLEAKGGLKLDKWMLYEQAAPEVMYLWTGR